LGDDRNVFLGKELLHNKECVAQRVTVMQKPLFLRLVVPLPPNYIAQQPSVQLMVHPTIDVKEFRELSDCTS
jgi:hypothetical protein